MAFTKDRVALAWFASPQDVDWSNLALSKVSRVLLPYQLAKDLTLLQRLASLGKHVVIRIEQDCREDAPTITRFLANMRNIVRIDAVILGCEPDGVMNWTYASQDWGQDFLYHTYRGRVDMLRGAVRGAGLLAVSPALSDPPEAISEDGTLRPGRYAYAEIMRTSYDSCDGNAVHLYALGTGNDVNDLRFKFGLKQAAETWHKPLWIDEAGVLLDNDVAKVQAYIRMADMLLGHPAGQRVEMFSFFTSTGTPGDPKAPAWDPRYLVKDPAAYSLLGGWIVS